MQGARCRSVYEGRGREISVVDAMWTEEIVKVRKRMIGEGFKVS